MFKKIVELVNSNVFDCLLFIIVYVVMKFVWRMFVNVGVWKCIVMNIFGNVLKYILIGWIEVKLKIV